MTHLLLVGISHHTAPVELRERVDFTGRGLAAALAALAERPGTGEAVVLSTCNRAELYVTCASPERTRQDLAEFISEFHGVPLDVLAAHFYSFVDQDVARHLFRVAAGLDSLVVGEPQILGQVKESYSEAAERQYTGALLNKLFHSAFAVGKRVRSETGLSEGAVSVSYAAVSLARKIFGNLKELSVLLVGAGEIGKLTARHLQSQNVRRLAIASRSIGHAQALAAEIGALSIDWGQLYEALISSDIVVTATGSERPILPRAEIENAMRARRNRPLFLIDIAVPRDVEPSAGDLEQVFLYNIDDLQGIVSDNLAKRTLEMQRAERIIADEVARFTAWLRSRDAIPTVVALRRRFEAIRRAELQRLEPKIAALSPEARARIDEVTRLIIEKLLLTPTEQLKSVSDEETAAAYTDALNRLFSLTTEAVAIQDEHSAPGRLSQDR